MVMIRVYCKSKVWTLKFKVFGMDKDMDKMVIKC